jgi:hypothetical protein
LTEEALLETEKIKGAAKRMKDDKKLPPNSELSKVVEKAKATNEKSEGGHKVEHQSDKR